MLSRNSSRRVDRYTAGDSRLLPVAASGIYLFSVDGLGERLLKDGDPGLAQTAGEETVFNLPDPISSCDWELYESPLAGRSNRGIDFEW